MFFPHPSGSSAGPYAHTILADVVFKRLPTPVSRCRDPLWNGIRGLEILSYADGVQLAPSVVRIEDEPVPVKILGVLRAEFEILILNYCSNCTPVNGIARVCPGEVEFMPFFTWYEEVRKLFRSSFKVLTEDVLKYPKSEDAETLKNRGAILRTFSNTQRAQKLRLLNQRLISPAEEERNSRKSWQRVSSEKKQRTCRPADDRRVLNRDRGAVEFFNWADAGPHGWFE